MNATRAQLLVLLALYVAYVALYRYVVIVPDTARDIVQGILVSQEHVFPGAGPLIADRWVLSPLWFYLVAALGLVTRSVVTLTLLVGAIAGLKIPLAYVLGRRVLDARFGMLFAALVTLPSWNVLEHLVWSHTNLVQVCALAACLALWRVHERPGDARWFVALLALALATQAHPTNLVFALALLPLLRATVLRAGWRGVLAGVLAGIVLALPSLLHELPRMAHMGFGVADAHAFSLANLAGAPAIGAKIVLQPWQVLAFLFAQQAPPLGAALSVFSFGLLALAGAGLALALARRDRLALALLAWLALALAFVAALRPWTPAYMAFAPGLIALAAIARGVHAAFAALPARAASAGTTLVAAVALAGCAAFVVERERSAALGEQHLPRMALIDVRKPVERTEPANVLFPVTAQRRAMRAWCRQETSAGVAGDLAAMLLMTQAAPWRLARCDESLWPRLAAQPGALAGYAMSLARELDLPQERMLGPYVLVPVRRAVAAPAAEPIAFLTAYPPHSLRGSAPESLRVAVALAPDELLVVTNLLEFFNPLEATVLLHGRALAPLAASENSRFWACPGAAAPCTLELELRAQRLHWAPAYVIARAVPGDEPSAACAGPCARAPGATPAADTMAQR